MKIYKSNILFKDNKKKEELNAEFTNLNHKINPIELKQEKKEINKNP